MGFEDFCEGCVTRDVAAISFGAILLFFHVSVEHSFPRVHLSFFFRRIPNKTKHNKNNAQVSEF